jgi:RimJ/RimL family protein N-acetyltransferase
MSSAAALNVRPARLEPWQEADLPLLKELVGGSAMMVHLGGAETAERIAARHARYLRLEESGRGRMFRILGRSSGAVGSVGYWERRWRGNRIYEIGWAVLPPFQGRGIGRAAAAAAIEAARGERKRRFLHAFPAADNEPANAICRRLGFTLREAWCEVEYPPGRFMLCNDWRLELYRNGD